MNHEDAIYPPDQTFIAKGVAHLLLFGTVRVSL